MGTTINIDAQVRDRLKTYGTAGMTYNDILRALMDRVDRDQFFAEARDMVEHPERYQWTGLDDVE